MSVHDIKGKEMPKLPVANVFVVVVVIVAVFIFSGMTIRNAILFSLKIRERKKHSCTLNSPLIRFSEENALIVFE